MNAKKITSLVLAAIMAAGTTVTAFAESHVTGTNGSDLSADRPLGFSDATIYEDKDGVLVPSTDYRPGDTFYIRLKELDSNGNKKIEDEKDDMQVYADWKVGKNAVEDVDIVYDKGTTKYTFTVDGKSLVANTYGELESDKLRDEIKGTILDEMAANPDFLKDDIDKATSKKTSGYHDGSKWYDQKGITAFASGQGYIADGQAWNTASVNGFIAKHFTESGASIESGYSLYIPSSADKAGVGVIAPTGGYEGMYQVMQPANFSITKTEPGEVEFASSSATWSDLENAGFAEEIKETTYVDSATGTVFVSPVTSTVYVDANNNLISEGDAVAAAKNAVAESTADAIIKAGENAANGYVIDYSGDWTYWVKISTKKDDTTKVLDLAGILYIGGSKTKAEKSDNTFQFDTSMDNRVYDDNKYVEVEDEWTFYPNSRSVVKFSDDAEDVVLYFGENEDAWFEVDARGQSALNMEFDFDWNEEIADLFPNANIDFLNFTSTPAFNRTGDLWITADPDTFIYEVTENGVKEIANAEYDEDEEAWHIRTRKLTAYAISDRELDTSKTLDGEDNTSSSNTSNNGGKDNPDTGR